MVKTEKSNPLTRSAYGARWDQFYRNFDAHGETLPLWDVPPAAASALDYARFREYLNPELPLVDLGCGTGRQTAFLAEKYPLAIGLDVSARAIELATLQYGRSGLEFQLLGERLEDFRQINHRLGDCNVYIRGVLHQIERSEFSYYREALILLMGTSGTLYFVEVADSIRAYLSGGSGSFSRLPGPIKRAFISNFPPQGLSLAGLPSTFPPHQFRVLAAGASELNTNIQFGADDPICIPAIYGVVRPINTERENGNSD